MNDIKCYRCGNKTCNEKQYIKGEVICGECVKKILDKFYNVFKFRLQPETLEEIENLDWFLGAIKYSRLHDIYFITGSEIHHHYKEARGDFRETIKKNGAKPNVQLRKGFRYKWRW